MPAPLALVLMHLGRLHPYEHALVLLLAFGPFVVLALAIRHVRRRDAAEEQAAREHGGAGAGHHRRRLRRWRVWSDVGGRG